MAEASTNKPPPDNAQGFGGFTTEKGPENYWWKGQNQRTFEIGQFPRCIADPLRPLNQADISNPLKNSVIHTGHAGSDGKKWGDIRFIDEMYLKNPVFPPDVINKPITPRKVKHNSLRLKHKNRKRFNYSKLSDEKFPAKPPTLPSIPQQESPSDIQLINFDDPVPMIRQKSFSASDLTREQNFQISPEASPIQPHEDSRNSALFHMYRNIPNQDPATSYALYENFETEPCVRVPVRPAPPIMLPFQPSKKPESSNKENYASNNFLPDDRPAKDNETETHNATALEYYDDFSDFDDDTPEDRTSNVGLSNVSQFENNEDNSIISPIVEDDPFDTSQIRLYDEPPNDVTTKHADKYSDFNNVNREEQFSSHQKHLQNYNTISHYNLSKSTNIDSNKNFHPDTERATPKLSNEEMNNQIRNMWLRNVVSPIQKEVIHDHSNVSTGIFSRVNTAPNLAVKSESPISSPPTTDLFSSQQKNVSFSSDVNSHSIYSLPKPSPFNDGLSRSTPSLVSIPANPCYQKLEKPFPTLDANFISELEKSLGKDQATANTYKEKNMESSTPTPLSAKVYNVHPSVASIRQETNLSLSQPDLQKGSESSALAIHPSNNNVKPSITGNAFSDLDVLSSSRTLGLVPNKDLDMSQYFQKTTAHVKPFRQQLPLSGFARNEVRPMNQHNAFTDFTLSKGNRDWQSYDAISTLPTRMHHSQQVPITSNPHMSYACSNQGIQPVLRPIISSNVPPQAPLHQTLHLSDPHQSLFQMPSRTADVLQPTVVVSPQLTVNYNQMVYSNGASGGDCSGNGDVLVGRVAAVVPGTSLDCAKQALHVASGDFQGAVQFLKVEKLYRLGLTNKMECKKILDANCWELERSASALLDKFC